MVVIEPHYLGSLEYFVLLKQHGEVLLEINDSFQKQTYRNRTYFLTSNKVQSLSMPVTYSSGVKTKEVKIDYSQRWIKDHWGAFYSGYGKAPFFEYFSEEFRSVWERKPAFLIDLNIFFFELIRKILKLTIDVKLTEDYKHTYENDYRNVINPKQPFSNRKIYCSQSYSQLFGNTFVPNLSIIDLIMCEGSNSVQILNASCIASD